jgi:hypothetical protein
MSRALALPSPPQPGTIERENALREAAEAALDVLASEGPYFAAIERYADAVARLARLGFQGPGLGAFAPATRDAYRRMMGEAFWYREPPGP